MVNDIEYIFIYLLTICSYSFEKCWFKSFAIFKWVYLFLAICGSAGKEFACNMGDMVSISRLGRSPRKGKGYPLQYSWASLVAQLVKNLPAMREIWVQSLGWEGPLEKGKATPLQYSGLENPHGWRSLAGYSPRSQKEPDTSGRLSTAQHSTRTKAAFEPH